MKNGIPAHMYYFLLDWKDKNLSIFNDIYGEGTSLNSFDTHDLIELHKKVINYDYLDIEAFMYRVMENIYERTNEGIILNAIAGAERDVQDCINILNA